MYDSNLLTLYLVTLKDEILVKNESPVRQRDVGPGSYNAEL